jgi:hypothetical protein
LWQPWKSMFGGGARVITLSVELLGIKSVSKKLKQGYYDSPTSGC